MATAVYSTAARVLDAYITDYKRLLDSIGSSLLLLVTGVVIGGLAGFVTGLATGWTSRVGYWTNPVLRLIGPIPATALIPIALFLFPDQFQRQRFSCRARDMVSGRGPDLVWGVEH